MRSFSRAVITGGAGFVGSHLCEQLLADGVEVHCLDNFLTGSPDNVAHLMDDAAFHLHRCDVTDYIHVPGPVDLVLHFASPASPADYLRLPIHTMKVGSIGTLHALGLAREKRARFVLASTSETYGDPQVHPQPETYWGHVNPVGPRGVYDEAKRFAEALTTAYRTSHAVDTAIVRIFNTYGPRMRVDDGRAIPAFITQALAGAPLTVMGDGTQTRSVCYIDDLVRGVLAVATSELAGPVNVGNPDEMSVLSIARHISAVTGSSSPITFVPPAVDDPKVRRPDTTLIETALGWRPAVDWQSGIERTIRWFAERTAPAEPDIKRARQRIHDEDRAGHHEEDLMNVSPIELQKALHGVEYPASKDDLLSTAEGNNAGDDILDALRALPDDDFDGPNKVSAAVADAT